MRSTRSRSTVITRDYRGGPAEVASIAPSADAADARADVKDIANGIIRRGAAGSTSSCALLRRRNNGRDRKSNHSWNNLPARRGASSKGKLGGGRVERGPQNAAPALKVRAILLSRVPGKSRGSTRRSAGGPAGSRVRPRPAFGRPRPPAPGGRTGSWPGPRSATGVETSAETARPPGSGRTRPRGRPRRYRSLSNGLHSRDSSLSLWRSPAWRRFAWPVLRGTEEPSPTLSTGAEETCPRILSQAKFFSSR